MEFHLVEIIQPTLDKNEHRIINLRSFVTEVRTWDIEPDEIQVSYDVGNLDLSLLLEKAVDVILS